MTILPQAFSDLVPLTGKWAKATFHERYNARLESSQAELVKTYDMLLPRMEVILEYLALRPAKEMDEADETLTRLAQAFMDIAPAVELFKQPEVLYGYDARRAVVTVYGEK